MQKKRSWDTLIGIIIGLAAGMTVCAYWQNQFDNLEIVDDDYRQNLTADDIHTVTRIVDGDTVVLDTGEKVRYIGVNTPEKGECYYAQATDLNSLLVLNKEVILVKDTSDTDRYGRLLRYVYVDGVSVNEELVRQGAAKAAPYKPDVKYKETFKELESQAKQSSVGLWKECQ